jgi:hypothetical protein
VQLFLSPYDKGHANLEVIQAEAHNFSSNCLPADHILKSSVSCTHAIELRVYTDQLAISTIELTFSAGLTQQRNLVVTYAPCIFVKISNYA